MNDTFNIGEVIDHPRRGSVSDPAAWWRRVCWVTDRVALSGDLNNDDVLARAQLEDWAAQGVTHILDVREEADVEWEATRIRGFNPDINYFNLGTHDNGGDQADWWFERGVAFVREALTGSDTKVLIHCHMGVNRGPSMGFAALLAGGMDPLDAMAAIRAARPIAGVIYAESALDWWLRSNDGDDEIRAEGAVRLIEWMGDNEVDVAWVVSRIWRADWAA